MFTKIVRSVVPWGYISPRGLANLASYTYNGKDLSFCGNVVLKSYWDFCLDYLVPLWIAPNLLTFIGLLCNITSYAALALTSANLYGETPWWTCVIFSVLTWSYMSLDSLDGKQARRTFSSSPLGELFDHVCDAMTVSLFAVTIGAIGGIGPILTFAAMMIAFVPFYMAHWEEYFVGELVLGKFDNPTEMEILLVLMSAVTAVATNSMWHIEIWGFEICSIAVGLIACGTVFMTVKNIIKVISKRHESHRPGVTLPVLFSELLPLVSLIILSCCWVMTSVEFYQENARVVLATLGLVFGILTSRLIVQRICKEDPLLFYPILIPLYVIVINNLIGYFFLTDPIIPELVNMWSYFGIALINFLCMAVSIINELCNHLNIRCFVIPYPPVDPKAVSRAPAEDESPEQSLFDRNNRQGELDEIQGSSF
eukprot:TRINITY_DN2820_c0_g1_i1.p1 TRINITY_DN2820_c0_g1~~TRINITY_DN2820_c0_g1_i1.p1  ORF type:complete len:425 (-),score=158.17 TRINITY_DN2820_c0_g1_i1:105-1379(-)